MSVRPRCMEPTAAGRVAVWTAVISVSAIDPHVVPVALGAAVAKETFDLLRARLQRISVLTYLRATCAATYLRIGPSPGAPALVLSVGSRWNAMGPDDEAGADLVHAGGDLPHPDSDLDADEFCIKQRGELLAYAMALTRSWPDAEDAVSHVVEKIYERRARNGTVCPEGRDPVAWAKTVIRNYVTDSYRRRAAEGKRTRVFAPSARDLAEDVTDQIIARNALLFVASLDSQAHQIAMMRWIDGLKPQEIAGQLGMNPRSVRTSLHRTRKKMRTALGVAEPRKTLREKTT